METQYVVVGLALAAVLGLAATRFGRRRSRAFPAAVEAALGTTVLGEVAEPLTPSALPALDEGTAAAEAFDHLASSVRDALGDHEACRTVVVTGPVPHDDNAWLGANIAIALARDGHDVLLVDGRLSDRDRRPVTSGPEPPGLYEVLQGVRLERAISPGPVVRLSVLPAGHSGLVPTTRLVESRFASLVDQATDSFETVVVLGPALSSARDVAVMAQHGGVLLAVPPHVSLRRLDDCGRRLRDHPVSLIGAVLVGHH